MRISDFIEQQVEPIIEEWVEGTSVTFRLPR